MISLILIILLLNGFKCLENRDIKNIFTTTTKKSFSVRFYQKFDANGICPKHIMYTKDKEWEFVFTISENNTKAYIYSIIETVKPRARSIIKFNQYYALRTNQTKPTGNDCFITRDKLNKHNIKTICHNQNGNEKIANFTPFDPRDMLSVQFKPSHQYFILMNKNNRRVYYFDAINMNYYNESECTTKLVDKDFCSLPSFIFKIDKSLIIDGIIYSYMNGVWGYLVFFNYNSETMYCVSPNKAELPSSCNPDNLQHINNQCFDSQDVLKETHIYYILLILTIVILFAIVIGLVFYALKLRHRLMSDTSAVKRLPEKNVDNNNTSNADEKTKTPPETQ